MNSQGNTSNIIIYLDSSSLELRKQISIQLKSGAFELVLRTPDIKSKKLCEKLFSGSTYNIKSLKMELKWTKISTTPLHLFWFWKKEISCLHLKNPFNQTSCRYQTGGRTNLYSGLQNIIIHKNLKINKNLGLLITLWKKKKKNASQIMSLGGLK